MKGKKAGVIGEAVAETMGALIKIDQSMTPMPSKTEVTGTFSNDDARVCKPLVAHPPTKRIFEFPKAAA